MSDNTNDLDQTDEETLTNEVSDDALEAAAGGGFGGAYTGCSFQSAPCC
jgi:hypothetical protein